ncbi:retrovirus-related Pol polyprotein from transposon opus isoform X2 [Anas platyrhynchos]|uniref:retrovirus-related Pol polyprotein from transposon opus isoform X2 n=1 Tax=Anas platyrhynchos TaxID=8839 RepID=UPI003AF214C2
MEFLIDTGASYSVLNQKLTPEDKDFVTVIGATGQQEKAFFLKPLKYKLGKQMGIHRFLYLPGSPKSLLGRDLLEQLEAEIIFEKGKIELRIGEEQLINVLSLALIQTDPKSEIPLEIINQVYPGVWATEVSGRAKNVTPIIIKLKPGEKPVKVKQYPLRIEDRKGIKEIIDRFIQHGLLIECESEYNTPILPIKKADGKRYRLVQDLRAINKITEDIHPVVANPYTLLTKLRNSQVWFTVLDLKDAFFCLPLATESQNLFAFEWENPDSGRKTQLTWTVLPQGFKNSPTIFGNQLAKELETWTPPDTEGALLQYVDDLLIATETKESCIQWTISLLNFLGLNGYRVSQQKVQLVQQHATYLGFGISGGQRELGTERKEVICRTPEPQTVKELRTFLGMTASFLSGTLDEPITHDCMETMETVYSSRPDLKEEPLEDADESWYTNGSSFVKQGQHKAGYAVTTAQQVIESKPLPPGTSAQKAEIIALTRALELAAGRKINIWTDSKYAFGVVHAHGAIWKERGLLTAQGKQIKHAEEILRLLEAVKQPEKDNP